MTEHLANGGLVREHDAFRVATHPVAHIQLRLIALCRHPSHKYRVVLGTQFVAKHTGEVIGDGYGTTMVIDKPVGCLCPL